MQQMLLATLVTLGLSPALAQQEPAPGKTGPSGLPLSAGGGPVSFYTRGQDDQLASRMIGAKVRDGRNEDIGVVRDLVMSRLGDVKAVVLDVSGHGREPGSLIAVNLVSLRIDAGGQEVRITLDATPEQLKTAPLFQMRDASEQQGAGAARP